MHAVEDLRLEHPSDKTHLPTQTQAVAHTHNHNQTAKLISTLEKQYPGHSHPDRCSQTSWLSWYQATDQLKALMPNPSTFVTEGVAERERDRERQRERDR